MERFIAAQAGRFEGEAEIPGDKSISHRAVMLGSIARGETVVRGFLEGEDCLATLGAFRRMGVPIERSSAGLLRITGVERLVPPDGPLDLGNSGTSLRLLTGLLAGQEVGATLTGDRSLRSRPMERIAAPLRAMGAGIETTDGRAPVVIQGGCRLSGIDYTSPVASAQIKSAILLAALGARGRTIIRSPGPSRDHTERMLTAMGAFVETDDASGVVALDGPVGLRAAELDVPADLSSAAFMVVGAVIGSTGPVTLRGVGVNPTRDGILRILEAMGARIDVADRRTLGGEPVADLSVRRSELEGIEIPPDWVPLAIDEFPAVCVAAAAARGSTTIRGAEELRHKETDRLAAMAAALSAVGIAVTESPDGLVVDGGEIRGGIVDARGDHRIAMAMSVAALASAGPIEIRDTENVATSFPTFVPTVRSLGLEIEVDRPRAA